MVCENGEKAYLGTAILSPACRIIGDLDEHAQPTSARLEYQDWFTPWIEYLKMSHEEREYSLSYAQVFYFGE